MTSSPLSRAKRWAEMLFQRHRAVSPPSSRSSTKIRKISEGLHHPTKTKWGYALIVGDHMRCSLKENLDGIPNHIANVWIATEVTTDPGDVKAVMSLKLINKLAREQSLHKYHRFALNLHLTSGRSLWIVLVLRHPIIVFDTTSSQKDSGISLKLWITHRHNCPAS